MFAQEAAGAVAVGVETVALKPAPLTVDVPGPRDSAADGWSPQRRATVAESAARASGPVLRPATRSVAAGTASTPAPVAALWCEVHQATGMVSVDLDLGVGDAPAVLQAHAFALGRPLIDIARDVVARRVEGGSALFG